EEIPESYDKLRRDCCENYPTRRPTATQLFATLSAWWLAIDHNRGTPIVTEFQLAEDYRLQRRSLEIRKSPRLYPDWDENSSPNKISREFLLKTFRELAVDVVNIDMFTNPKIIRIGGF